MHRIATTLHHDFERTLAHSLLGVSAMLLACYLLFLTFSVSAIIARNVAERDLVALSATLAELESRHVALDARVTLSLARDEGFAETAPSLYVERTKPRQMFTLESRSY